MWCCRRSPKVKCRILVRLLPALLYSRGSSTKVIVSAWKKVESTSNVTPVAYYPPAITHARCNRQLPLRIHFHVTLVIFSILTLKYWRLVPRNMHRSQVLRCRRMRRRIWKLWITQSTHEWSPFVSQSIRESGIRSQKYNTIATAGWTSGCLERATHATYVGKQAYMCCIALRTIQYQRLWKHPSSTLFRIPFLRTSDSIWERHSFDWAYMIEQ